MGHVFMGRDQVLKFELYIILCVSRPKYVSTAAEIGRKERTCTDDDTVLSTHACIGE